MLKTRHEIQEQPQVQAHANRHAQVRAMAATESREHNYRHGNAVRDPTDGGRGLGGWVRRGYYDYEDKLFAKCFDGSEGKLPTF